MEDSDSAADARHRGDDEQSHQYPSERAFPALVGHRPQEMASTRPAERTGFECQAAFLHVGERSDDHRSDDRQQTTNPGPEAAFRVETPRSLALADRRRPVDERGDRLDRGDRHERSSWRDPPPLEIEHEGAWFGGHDEEADRQRDRDEANEG